ncbi:hypothetical protein PFICI_13052 [Pestalotiopsis fici W106-1]|uniref:Uncharacterized protein n=1 Tax=Pestalotiopsis fici (strain W106-1 / CGMCC3.15140) TaxID=1229662 RepID=W3WL09_PESFW|nr:uncharacterized protein PFICI_13052 [Pestalotiopsis fici W106-1]ETS74568.1 hypothetical protein PFICI_13052 [Pestalotiopsis fici W106-1]
MLLQFSQRTRWLKTLRASSAVREIRRSRPDLVPIEELKEATNAVLKSKNLSVASEKCDRVLFEYLFELRGELPLHHVGIIACAHTLSYDMWRDVVGSVRPDPDTEPSDEHFDLRLRAYLSTVIASWRMNKALIDKRVFHAALELLRVMSQPPERLSSVGRLLLWIGEDVLKELIPTELAQTVLARRDYRIHLQRELSSLSEQCDWVEVRKLVGFFDRWRDNQCASRILPEIIPDHQKWLNWRPTVARIKRWSQELRHHENYSDLIPLLALEGPDISIQGRPTARQSPVAIEALRLADAPPELLDDALNLLDVAIDCGGNAVGFLAHFLLHCGQLNVRGIERARLCLAAGYHEQEDSSVSSQTAEPNSCGCNQRDVDFAVIPVSASIDTNMSGFVSRVLDELKTRQVEFCHQLQVDAISVNLEFAQRICVLGSALRSAHWHSAYIPLEFAERFRRFPSKADLESKIRGLQRATGIERHRYVDDLADCVGFSQRDSYPSSPAAPSNPHRPPEDPIWLVPDDALEGERPLLRSQVLMAVYETNPDLAIECLKQSKNEPDTFIKALLYYLPKTTTPDMICVNLAGFLGPRNAPDGKACGGASGGNIHNAWKSLLMHMMRSLGPGMLERCAKTLERKILKSWLRNLNLLYGDSYLDPDGGLGITKEKIKGCLERERSA